MVTLKALVVATVIYFLSLAIDSAGEAWLWTPS